MPRAPKSLSFEITKSSKPGFKFVASIYGSDGKRQRQFFRTRQDAEDARRVKTQEWLLPEYHVEFTSEEREAVILARKQGVDLMTAVQNAAAARSAAAQSIALSEGVEIWLGEMQITERTSRHRRAMRNFFDSVLKAWGDVIVSDVTAKMVGGYIHGATKVSKTTRANYRRSFSSFFSFANTRQWLAENPMAQVAAPKGKAHSDDVAILSPEECRQLLAAAQIVEPEILPALAVALFAGLRAAELHRLAWEDVWLERGLIVVKADKAKTGSRRMVTIHAPLAAILEMAPRPVPRLVWPLNGARQWDRVIKAANWIGHKHWKPASHADAKPWPANALRHSFVSYHVALFQDAARTALEAGHSQQMLFRHYRELVSEAQADEFWSLLVEESIKVASAPVASVGE